MDDFNPSQPSNFKPASARTGGAEPHRSASRPEAAEVTRREVLQSALAGLVAAGTLDLPARAAPAALQAGQAPVNLLRNGSFELSARFNGEPMRHGEDFYLVFVKGPGGKKSFTELPVSGWWAVGADANGIEVAAAAAHSGRQGLRIRADHGGGRMIVSSLSGPRVTPGPVTLSAYFKTSGARGRLELDLLSLENRDSARLSEAQGRAPVSGSVALPADAADWVRVSVTVQNSSRLVGMVRLRVASGTVCVDDVQLEQGATATPFNVRPAEWLRLAFVGCDEAVLPKWVASDPIPRRIIIHNDSRTPLAGRIVLRYGPWNAVTQRTLAAMAAASLKPGQSRSFPLSAQGLPPNAYVACVSLEGETPVPLDGAREFDPRIPIGGEVSNSMLLSRSAIRFAIAPEVAPAKIFGVGNDMLFEGGGGWFGGYTIKQCDLVLARKLGMSCTHTGGDDESAFLLAVGALPAVVTYSYSSIPAGSPPGSGGLLNPGVVDLFNPVGMKVFRETCGEIGRQCAPNPFVAAATVAGERPYLHAGVFCASPYADEDFRQWCRRKYGTLDILNGHWSTNYASWAEVEPIVSYRFVNQIKQQEEPPGPAAINRLRERWGGFSADVLKRMRANPGGAMDWLRWQTDSSLRMFATYRHWARKHDHKTLYGSQQSFPGFCPQVFMPLVRQMDVTLLDTQYTTGFPRPWGTPYERMDILEMSESVAPDKPLWGIEVYYQPQWPAGFMALQNWGMVAHGMSNNLVFAWKPHVDGAMVTAPRAWEKPNAPKMWAIIDVDGTRLPAYYAYVQSMREIQRYHKRFDGLSIHRAPSDIAFYVSADTNEYVRLETADQAWQSIWQRTRNVLNYTLRMSGISADYVDDETLPASPGRYKTIVVPASYILSQDAGEKLANFAGQGGTVILAGPVGLRDPWLKAYATLGGPAWAELGWRAPDFKTDFSPGSIFRGINIGQMRDAEPVRDAQGHPVGWTRRWGKGKLVAYGIFPDLYTADPHLPAALAAWGRQLMQLGGLQSTGGWFTARTAGAESATAPPAAREGQAAPSQVRFQGGTGAGDPVVEIVTRIKTDREKFVFCLNQGGAGQGMVNVPVGGGSWSAEDAIAERPIRTARVKDGVWQLPLHIEPWGYRVIRLTR